MPLSCNGCRANSLYRPAEASDQARKRSWTKRPGLEDSKRAHPNASIGLKPTVIVALLCSASLLSGCLSDTFEVRQPLPESHSIVTLAPEVLLEVDDTGVKWGSGRVGEVLSAVLVKNQTFHQVHYPIYPSHRVPFKLKVVATGGIESETGLGMVKAFVTGFLFFLPVGVIQYEDTFSITAAVSVADERQSYEPLTVQSSVAANHTLFSSPEPYARRASALALEEFSNRVSVALTKHPEWFPR